MCLLKTPWFFTPQYLDDDYISQLGICIFKLLVGLEMAHLVCSVHTFSCMRTYVHPLERCRSTMYSIGKSSMNSGAQLWCLSSLCILSFSLKLRGGWGESAGCSEITQVQSPSTRKSHLVMWLLENCYFLQSIFIEMEKKKSLCDSYALIKHNYFMCYQWW